MLHCIALSFPRTRTSSFSSSSPPPPPSPDPVWNQSHSHSHIHGRRARLANSSPFTSLLALTHLMKAGSLRCSLCLPTCGRQQLRQHYHYLQCRFERLSLAPFHGSTADASWSHSRGTGSMADNKPSSSDRSERSYLSAAVESITPWAGSRSVTPKTRSVTDPPEISGLQNQHGGYHGARRRYMSFKHYPSDCPPLNVRWFYAVDVRRSPRLTYIY